MNLASPFAAAKLVLAAASVGFHVFIVFSGLIPALILRPLHVALAMPFVFVFGPARGRVATRVGYALCALGVAGCLYIVAFRRALVDQYGAVEGWFQHALAVTLILIVLEMARRAVKPVMPAIALIVLLYGLLGEYIPGEWGHAGMPLDSFLGTLVLSEGGLWGSLTAVSAELVAPFLVLGAFVAAGEAGTGFMALAQKIAGRFRAGAAKVEVIASALYGTISGSASANVASTGTFTIPIMIRQGYPPSFAAAVEAVASTGGQIMPPIMGAAAFVMAEFLAVSYFQVTLWALIPAILYYVAVFFAVHFEAKRVGLLGLPRSEIPRLGQVMRERGHLFIPLAVILGGLIAGYSAPYCALAGTLSCIPVAMLRKSTREGIGWHTIWDSLEEGAKNAVAIALACACAGIVIGVITLTGAAINFTSVVVGLSQDLLLLALILTMIAGIVLGMGMPTTPAYIVMVSLLVPALIKLGAPVPAAHMFAFYFAILSAITPPVALAVYAAAGLAKANLWESGWAAVRVGAAGFIVPFMFVYEPALLMINGWDEWHVSLHALVTATIGCMCLAAGMFGYLIREARVWERALLLAAALLLIKPGLITDLIGLALLATVIVNQKFLRPATR